MRSTIFGRAAGGPAVAGALAALGMMTLSGCGGGSNVGGNSPLAFLGSQFTGLVNFDSGQTGTVQLTRTSPTAASGTLTVTTSAQQFARPHVAFAIPVGVYTITGTYDTAAGTFTAAGTIPNLNGGTPFTVAGTLATSTTAGAFTVRTNNQTIGSGTIPATGTGGTGGTGGVTPGNAGTFTATLGGFSGTYNGIQTSPLAEGFTTSVQTVAGLNILTGLGATTTQPSRSVTITINAPFTLTSGEDFSVANGADIAYLESQGQTGAQQTIKGWVADTGNVHIDSIQGSVVHVTVSDVPGGTGSAHLIVAPGQGPLGQPNSAVGTLTLSGSN